MRNHTMHYHIYSSWRSEQGLTDPATVSLGSVLALFKSLDITTRGLTLPDETWLNIELAVVPC